MIEVRITSCPREVDYLQRTINALRETTLPSPVVHYDHEKKGASLAFLECIRDCTSDVMVIQDDFLVDGQCSHSFLISLLWEAEVAHGDSIISGYTHGYPESDDLVKVDVHGNLKINCNGGCCWLIRERYIQPLLAWSHDADTSVPLPQMIGAFCRDTGINYLITPQNLGQHIGVVSSIRDVPYPIIDRSSL